MLRRSYKPIRNEYIKTKRDSNVLHMMRTLVSMSALLLSNCSAPTPDYKVEYRGALKTLMHGGVLRGVAALDTLRNVPHLFALGALENLKGEILIYDSQAFVTSVRDGAVQVARDFHHNAALLVYTQIENWREFSVPREVQSLADFETFLLQTARQCGLKIDEPLSFLLKGKTSFVDWHVIDWAEGDTAHTHEKHRASGLHGRLEKEAVEILGFYSNKHHGVFTHRGSNLHLHVKTASGNFAAHVDDVRFNGAMSLFLPK